MRRYATVFLLSVIVLLLCSACATHQDPTGGAALQQEIPGRIADEEKELRQAALKLEQQIETEGFRYKDDQLDAYLESVARRLLSGATSVEVPRVRIIRSPIPNAFALPNGTIHIHTGLVAKMENEAQLAAILGHELTHFTHRHALQETRKKRERSSFSRAVESVMSRVGTVLGGDEGGQELKGLVGDIRDVWVQASLKGYSRELETEADEEGLKVMVRAGYDPAEAPRIFELLKQDLDETKGREPYFFSTHPRLQERIDNYRRLVAERNKSQAAAQTAPQEKGREEYSRQTARLLLDNVVMDIRSGRLKSAGAALEKSLLHEPQNARVFFLRGEMRRHVGEFSEAIDEYREAARLDPAYAEPHREMGYLFFRMKRLEEAFAAFEQYLRLKPDAAEIVDIRRIMTP